MNELLSVAISTVMLFGTTTVHITKDLVAPPVFALDMPLEAPRMPVDERKCSCVLFARSIFPELPLGDASDLVPNSPFPRVGGAVIIDYGDTIHVALVADRVSISGDIPLHDANFLPCQETWRTINISDPRIKGYWNKLD